MGVLKECWCAEGVLTQEKRPEEDSSARLEHSQRSGQPSLPQSIEHTEEAVEDQSQGESQKQGDDDLPGHAHLRTPDQVQGDQNDGQADSSQDGGGTSHTDLFCRDEVPVDDIFQSQLSLHRCFYL